MARVGLFFGTQTGNTETIATQIQEALGGESAVEIHDISDASPDDFAAYDCIIVGCPTWNVGEMQSDWAGFYEDDLGEIDFSGKKVAYFGAGDQVGYSENFQDAMGILEAKISELGGQTVGKWSTDGYEHSDSKAVGDDGKFVGLALDEDNQPELTEERIQQWTQQLKSEFGLS